MATETSAPTGTQAIDRAAELLVRVVDSGRPLAVGELATLSHLRKSTTSRLVGSLVRHGLVERTADGRLLRAGPVLLRFARQDGLQGLVVVAEPALDLLVGATG